MKAVCYINQNGKEVRWATTWDEYVKMYIQEIKEKYGNDTKVVVKEI